MSVCFVHKSTSYNAGRHIRQCGPGVSTLVFQTFGDRLDILWTTFNTEDRQSFVYERTNDNGINRLGEFKEHRL